MNPYLGEIRLFAGNFAPRGWAFCNGQIMSISQNTALFSLLGTFYGGNGQSNFGLPDLRGRVPVNQGNGPGLIERDVGESAGQEAVVLTSAELPVHSHALNASAATPPSLAGGGVDPSTSAQVPASPAKPKIYTTAEASVNMSTQAIGFAGGNQAHNNMAPSLALNFIIALQGIFPPRS